MNDKSRLLVVDDEQDITRVLGTLLGTQGYSVRTLLAEVWERSYTEQLDSVRALIRQLRKKIEPNPSAPRYLKTEPWIGCRFYPGD